ncbi:MAG: transposase [Mycobacterium sp.]
MVRSLPGMGATLTAEFLAEAGDLSRFPTADALAARPCSSSSTRPRFAPSSAIPPAKPLPTQTRSPLNLFQQRIE